MLPRPDTEAFARIAELIARFIGTARFLVIQTVVVLIWIALNIAMPFMKWDPYPFILLNLAFSTQAAYAAPLILLAQNRQDDRDRASLTEDRAAAVRMREDTEFLAREVAALRLGVADAATRQYVRGELTHQFDALRSDLEQLVRSAVQTAAGGGAGPVLATAAAGSATTAGGHGHHERGGRQSPANDTASDGTALLTATGGAPRPTRPQPAADLLVPSTVRSPRSRSTRAGRRAGGTNVRSGGAPSGTVNGTSNSTSNGTSGRSGDDQAICGHCGSPSTDRVDGAQTPGATRSEFPHGDGGSD